METTKTKKWKAEVKKSVKQRFIKKKTIIDLKIGMSVATKNDKVTLKKILKRINV